MILKHMHRTTVRKNGSSQRAGLSRLGWHDINSFAVSRGCDPYAILDGVCGERMRRDDRKRNCREGSDQGAGLNHAAIWPMSGHMFKAS